jgi:acyl-CoA reductase-like NAD-dependent aldehyde dehydrogenase
LLKTSKQQLRPGKLSINGCPEDAQSGGTIDIVNPASGDLLTTLPDANRARIITS